MEKVNIDELLKSALVELQEYLSLQLRYNKMLLAKRLGEVSSYFTLFMLLLGLGGFFTFFLSFAFVEWFNEIFESLYYGHLILSGFYLILILILVIFRRSLIFNPIRKLFGQIFIGEESESPQDILSFKSQQKLTLNLKKHKSDLDEKELHLKDSFSKLGNKLTITNIIQTVAINAYTSFVTTSNIVKTVYNLFKRLGGKNKRSKKKRKKSPPEIDNR